MSAQEVTFTRIYLGNRWGGPAGSWCSGSGSHEASIVAPYVATITAQLQQLGASNLTAVDLGCGDFSVQHLSNQQILAVLLKLARCRRCFITEHHPSPYRLRCSNLDPGGGHPPLPGLRYVPRFSALQRPARAVSVDSGGSRHDAGRRRRSRDHSHFPARELRRRSIAGAAASILAGISGRFFLGRAQGGCGRQGARPAPPRYAPAAVRLRAPGADRAPGQEAA